LGKTIDASTRFCAVYGHPIKHSASPAMHNSAFAELDLNWLYAAFDVAPGELRQAIAGAKVMKFIGLNLTVPHKLIAVEFMDHLDESARKWGAVNTVCFEARNEDGQWQRLAQIAPDCETELRSVGFNTDADAIVRSLGEDLAVNPRGASVLLLGVGGAGRVAALRLGEEGAGHLFLVNRTEAKAAAIAMELRERFPSINVTLGYPRDQVDLVINATSLGLKEEDPLPFDDQRFSLTRANAVYDMIYRPAESKFLRTAKASGCRVANGLGMLLYQGASAFEIWTGRPAPVAVMRRALQTNIYGR
jgi:shikimate dehydrogenase